MSSKKQKIKILQRTVCDGENVGPGDVVSVSEKDARFLIALGKAEDTTARVGKAKQIEEVEPSAKAED